MSNHFKNNVDLFGLDIFLKKNPFKSKLGDLLDEYATKLGPTLANKGLTRSQMRRFYQELKSIEGRLNGSLEAIMPLVQMFKAKAHYASGRKDQTRVPLEFVKLIDVSVDRLKGSDKEEFKAFVKFFEALVAYHYEKAKE
ncbi:MAG: type III-A CRISPR-associated protein Csm2 [Actinobacteria bacterium]|nr:type III-A CRISPR-associated protein Csm2 [Actinomycetota bacterium]